MKYLPCCCCNYLDLIISITTFTIYYYGPKLQHNITYTHSKCLVSFHHEMGLIRCSLIFYVRPDDHSDKVVLCRDCVRPCLCLIFPCKNKLKKKLFDFFAIILCYMVARIFLCESRLNIYDW